MTREQFESAIGTEMELVMGDDGMCCHVKGNPNEIWVDNGNGGVFAVNCNSATDISTDSSYSVYPVKNDTHDCVILFLNVAISGIGTDGGFALYESLAQVEEFVYDARQNNEEGY